MNLSYVRIHQHHQDHRILTGKYRNINLNRIKKISRLAKFLAGGFVGKFTMSIVVIGLLHFVIIINQLERIESSPSLSPSYPTSSASSKNSNFCNPTSLVEKTEQKRQKFCNISLVSSVSNVRKLRYLRFRISLNFKNDDIESLLLLKTTIPNLSYV